MLFLLAALTTSLLASLTHAEFGRRMDIDGPLFSLNPNAGLFPQGIIPGGPGMPAPILNGPASTAIAQGALVITQPNMQTYAVEKRQMIVTWQPVDPTISLAALPPNLIIECYPEVPITVGGPFGFTGLVRTDKGEYKYDIPKGWAGEAWNIVLREQGGSTVIAGQRFAIKPEGTQLAPTTNLAGNPMFNPGNPNGWPARSGATAIVSTAFGMGVVGTVVAGVATILALVLV